MRQRQGRRRRRPQKDHEEPPDHAASGGYVFIMNVYLLGIGESSHVLLGVGDCSHVLLGWGRVPTLLAGGWEDCRRSWRWGWEECRRWSRRQSLRHLNLLKVTALLIIKSIYFNTQ